MADSVGHHLGAILLQLAQRSGSATPLRPIWARLVGPVLAAHSVPLHLTSGELVIRCESQAWVNALEEKREALLRSLGSVLGSGSIRSLRWMVE